MHTPEIEVAFRRYIGDVRGNLQLLAILPYPRGGNGVIDSGQHEGDIMALVEIEGDKGPVVVGDLFLLDPISDFQIKTRPRANNGDAGISVEEVKDTSCGDLKDTFVSSCV